MKHIFRYSGNWIYALVGTTLLLTGVNAAWAVCPEGKSETVLYTPSGNANTLCVSDNALSGIENANANHDKKWDVCEEVTCPCWDAETLENLPDLGPQLSPYPICLEDYRVIIFTGYDPLEPEFNPDIIVFRSPDYYGEIRGCAILPSSEFATWPFSEYYVGASNLSQAEADACANILRGSKWWNMCSEVRH